MTTPLHADAARLQPATRIVVPGVGGDAAGASWLDRFLEAHNYERAKAGVPALRGSELLSRVAQVRVDDMVQENYFGHVDPNNNPGKYDEIARREGLTSFAWLGENLALNNYPDPLPEAMRELMASPGHRANILSGDFDAMGAAAQIRPADAAFVFAIIYSGGATNV